MITSTDEMGETKMAKEYGDSADFTADLDKMVAGLANAVEILQKPEFLAWMQATDKNYCAPNNEFVLDHASVLKLTVAAHRAAHNLELNLIELDE
jgi:hypothetical protein